jgi:hypothetical protein
VTVATGPAVLEGARLLARHGGVVEVRILKTPRGTVSGYFDNLGALVKAIRRWDGRANVYVTLNPVLPELLARSVNRLREFVRETTTDREILHRIWFPTDFDPVRPTGISATDDEMEQARTRRNEAVAFLIELGFPAAVTALSGNGAHAVWSVDLPNDEAATRLVQAALKALAARFSDQVVTCDETVFNAARIWKLYGTTAVKGDPLPDRPHRRAMLEHVPEDLVVVERAALEALAAMAPVERAYHQAPVSRPAARDDLDVGEAFQARGWYLKPLRDGKHAVRCPWVAQHSGESGVTETVLFEPGGPDQPWGFDCKHAHCAGRQIREVYALLRGAGSSPVSGNGHGHPSEPDPDGPVLVQLSTVAPEAVAWCWPGRFAFGKIGLLIAEPGVRKSYLATDLEARVTRGAPWPAMTARA